MKKTLIAALTLAGLLAVGPAASAALHSSNGTPTAVSMKATHLTKLNLRVAFAAGHHVSVKKVSAYGAVKYARYGKAQYALASFRAKGLTKVKASFMPEAFYRSSVRAHWVDKGATFGKPCKRLPAAVVKLFGYAKKCGLTTTPTPTPPPTTTTTTDPTTTTPAPPSGPPTVTPPPAQPGASADLALVTIGAAAPDGSNCDVSYTVHNNGPAENTSVMNRITVTTPAGKSYDTTQGMRTLLGNEQTGLTASVPVDCTTAGTYTITVEVDYDNQLPESNEQNNIGQTTTNPPATQLPDLVITGAGVSNCNTAWITVKNQGNGSSPAESVDLLLRIYNSAKQFAGGQQFDSPALAPGDSQTLSMAYKGDCSGLIITGDADSFSKITESNESNNYWSNQ